MAGGGIKAASRALLGGLACVGLGRAAAGAGGGAGAQDLVHDREQLRDPQRLAHVAVHTGLEALLAVALHGLRRERDDRHVAPAPVLAGTDAPRRRVAAEL